MAGNDAPPPEPTPSRASGEPVRPGANGPPALPRPEVTAPTRRPAPTDVGQLGTAAAPPPPAPGSGPSAPPTDVRPMATRPEPGPGRLEPLPGPEPPSTDLAGTPTRATQAPATAAEARTPSARAPDQPGASAGTGTGDLSPDRLLARPPGGPAIGWQAVVYRLSGGRLRPPPGPVEVAHLQMQRRIGAPIAGCRRIAVIALKGGVGKTTTTACLGAIFAQHRGDRVVAVDANPDPGTLGYRIRRDTLRTAKDLLANVDKLERYADIRAYASQTDLRLEVIVSEADPGRSEMFDEHDYREVAAVLERFYSLILTDCGPGLLHSAMRAILPTADQLVVVSAPSLDGARSASLTLDWLEQHGHERLARSCVVVINGVRERGLVDVDKLQEHFSRRCRAVVRVPFDRHLETGAEIVLDELAPATRRAYVRLAAAVADGFDAQGPEGRPT
jgi:MinD-like ATPase involved in chromosome partitioning or flagellar assembly